MARGSRTIVKTLMWGAACALIVVPSAVGGSITCGATTCWNNPSGDSNWFNSSDWSNGTPNTSTDAEITTSAAFQPVIGSTGAGVQNLTIDANGSLTLNDSSNLTVGDSSGSSTITLNAGSTLNLSSAGNVTDLILGNTTGGQVNLTGAGTLTLSNNVDNRIYGAASSTVLSNSATIQGAGIIEPESGLSLSNSGTVNSNDSAGLTLQLATTNTGTLEATSGSTLSLSNSSITNTNGVIQTDGTLGSTVALGSSSITGGKLQTTGSGVITTSSATLNGSVELNGALNINDGTTLNLGSGMTLNIDAGAGLNLNSAGNTTNLVVGGGTVTLNGPGVVNLGNNADNRIYGGATTTLINNTTIQGSGQIFTNSGMSLTNNAIVDANSSPGLSISLSTLTNPGTLEASSGGTLSLNASTIDNTNGIIQALNGSTVDLNSANITNGTLTTAGTGVLAANSSAALNGAVALNGKLNIVDGDNLTLGSGMTLTIGSTGSLNLNSVSSDTNLIIGGGTVTLDGPGGVVLGSNGSNRIYGSAATNLINNTDISGVGQIFTNTGLSLTNQGTIDANLSGSGGGICPTGGSLCLDLTVTNSNIMQASNGGTLALTGSTVFNSNGTIQALNGSTVQLNSSGVTGGILSTTGTGVITSNSAALTGGIAVNGTLNVNDNNSLELNGTTITFGSGSINLNSAGDATDLKIYGMVTLSGTGSINMSNSIGNRIYGNGTSTLINNTTIQGAGQIFTNSGLTLQNNSTGIVDANQTASLTLTLTATNTGTLEASGGGTLIFSDANVTNTGGTIQALNASTVQVNSSTITDGTLTTSGSGAIQSASSTLAGTMNLNGTLNILDNNNTTLNTGLSLTIGSGGSLNLLSAGDATDLRVGTTTGGMVTLSGAGSVTLSNNPNNRIYGDTSVTLVNNTTIQGAGQIFTNSGLSLTNGINGTVLANDSNHLVLDLSVTNNGTLQSAAGSTLDIQGTGLLTNFNASTDTLTGGTYHSAGTIQWVGANVVNNDAAIILDGAGGQILNSSNSTNALAGFNNNESGGAFTVENGQQFNDGSNSFVNAGNVNVLSDSGFETTSIYAQSAGTTVVNGTLEASLLLLNGGTLEIGGGSGDVDANVTQNAGVIESDPGSMQITGNYIMEQDGMLNIDLTSETIFDELEVSGSAYVDGTIDVSLLDYTGGTNSYTILSSDGLMPGLDLQIDLPTVNGYTFSDTITSDDILINVTQLQSATPEPSTILLLFGGALAVAGIRRFRKA